MQVLTPFGDGVYAAVVEMNGRYPEAGMIAHNHGRDEFLFVLTGSITVTCDSRTVTLATDQTFRLANGARYSISGQGKVLVLVSDTPGGRSEIVRAL